MEPRIGIRGKRLALLRRLTRDPRLNGAPNRNSGKDSRERPACGETAPVSMEPRIGIRGKTGRRSGPTAGSRSLNGAPNRNSGKALLPRRLWPLRSGVSMEPRIGIRGKGPLQRRTRQYAVVSMEPRIGIRGKGASRCSSGRRISRLNGAPNRNSGKALDPSDRAALARVSQWSPE